MESYAVVSAGFKWCDEEGWHYRSRTLISVARNVILALTCQNTSGLLAYRPINDLPDRQQKFFTLTMLAHARRQQSGICEANEETILSVILADMPGLGKSIFLLSMPVQ